MKWSIQIACMYATCGLLMPATANAVALGVYEQAAKDSAKQSKLLNEAYDTAVARTLAGLRVAHFKDGKQKTPGRIENDRKLANAVEALTGHLTRDQSGALIIMIDQYAQAQPDTELEDVIISFLLTEAKKRAGQGQ